MPVLFVEDVEEVEATAGPPLEPPHPASSDKDNSTAPPIAEAGQSCVFRDIHLSFMKRHRGILLAGYSVKLSAICTAA